MDLWKTGLMSKVRILGCAALTVLILAACATKPQLLPRSGGNPTGTDLSGNWALQGSAELPRVDEQKIIVPRSGPTGENRSQSRPRRERRSNGSSVHVFMETGKALRISQTEYSLFISFDRAVVEEYTFGENRTVSVGPIEAQRVSGWNTSTYVVETMDEDGNLLTETWRVEGDVLVRNVTITRGNDMKLGVQQVFDRA